MTCYHYTSVPQLALILKDRQIKPSYHEGFAKDQVSLMPFGSDAPKFFWNEKLVENSFLSDKRLARVTCEVESPLVWSKACGMPRLVKLTKEVADCSEWLVTDQPIEILYGEIFWDGQWLRVSVEFLATMLKGKSIKIRRLGKAGKPTDTIYHF